MVLIEDMTPNGKLRELPYKTLCLKIKFRDQKSEKKKTPFRRHIYK